MTIRKLTANEIIVKMTFSHDFGPGKSVHSDLYILNLQDDWTEVREALEHSLYMDFEEAVIVEDPRNGLAGTDITECFYDPEDYESTFDPSAVLRCDCELSGVCGGPSCPDYHICILS